VEVHAAIDVGSNSVKLLVLRLAPEGGYEILLDDTRVTGLGRNLGDGGPLDAQAREDTLSCLREYLERAAALGAGQVRVAGTAAMRRATDAPELLAAIEQEGQTHGLAVTAEVLSGEDEARLSRAVALRELPSGSPDVVFFDVGGGSTEITVLRGREALKSTSLPLGARRCTDAAGVVQPVMASMRERLDAMIEMELRGAPGLPRQADGPGQPAAPRVAGLGGTSSSMVWLLRGLRGEPAGDPHLARVTLVEGEYLLHHLADRSLREVRGLPNLDPARAEVIYAGVLIICAVVRRCGAQEFVLVDRGLRFGLLLA
jgi:exopolyphosphatase/guanosine-5'-triphosphate,3'-diphosphate pyrophosphatase